MKIVYDNIIFSLQRIGGISFYWSELSKRLKNKTRVSFFGKENTNVFFKDIGISQQNESMLPSWIVRYVPFIKGLEKGSIFHSSYYRVSLGSQIKNVVTVHDFTYEKYGSGLSRLVHRLQKSFAIRRAAGIICVSENTKKDLLEFFPNIDQSKVRVIYNGSSPDFFQSAELRLSQVEKFIELQDKKIIFFIGSRAHYKRFDLAVDVVSRIPDIHFVIAGGGALSWKEQDMLDDKLLNRYTYYSYLDNDELNVMYNHAHCLLYPSQYEGFGIPVIDAMRAGCPVVAQNTSSIAEIATRAALLSETGSVVDFMKQIQLLDDGTIRSKFIDQGLQRAQQFSWDKCFDETYNFYKDLSQ